MLFLIGFSSCVLFAMLSIRYGMQAAVPLGISLYLLMAYGLFKSRRNSPMMIWIFAIWVLIGLATAYYAFDTLIPIMLPYEA